MEGFAAVGMAGSEEVPLNTESTHPLPFGSELMLLPERFPVLYNLASGRIETVRENPFVPGERIFPVAAFNSPGYVITRVSAYREAPEAAALPLFSYGAVGWGRGGFRSAVLQVDREPRQDLRQMKIEDVQAGIRRLRKKLPGNRLRKHLENCALRYGCPAGKNFFLRRYEAPLPTARACNARCLGCLSLQPAGDLHCSQERIAFTPTPDEISAVALEHLLHVPRSVVSFGQGCEGDPLTTVDVIAPAIRQIRTRTARGTINMNTNGGHPAALERLFDAGLDSIRISLNSCRRTCYEAYFRPVDYRYEDVLQSIDLAARRNKFISINYLNSPGFTDAPEECRALLDLLKAYPINFIQWRNLNYDPLRYWATMNAVDRQGPPIGMKSLIAKIRSERPGVNHGYFNPPKEKWH